MFRCTVCQCNLKWAIANGQWAKGNRHWVNGDSFQGYVGGCPMTIGNVQLQMCEWAMSDGQLPNSKGNGQWVMGNEQ